MTFRNVGLDNYPGPSRCVPGVLTALENYQPWTTRSRRKWNQCKSMMRLFLQCEVERREVEWEGWNYWETGLVMLERLQGTICVLTLLGWPSQEIETEPRNGAKWSESRGGSSRPWNEKEIFWNDGLSFTWHWHTFQKPRQQTLTTCIPSRHLNGGETTACLPDMFPNEKGELPNSILRSSDPVSLEGVLSSWCCRRWCGKSGLWAARMAGWMRGGGGRVSRGGEADRGLEGGLRSRGLFRGPGNPKGLKGKCSAGWLRLGVREVGIFGKKEPGIPGNGGRGKNPGGIPKGVPCPKCFWRSAIDGCSPRSLETVRGVILVSVTLCLFFLGVTVRLRASSCSLSSSFSSSLIPPLLG